MSADVQLRRAKRPKGVILLVILFYIAAGLVVVSALATGEERLPSDISALVTIYLLVLAWGLWKLFRWAWFATLIMFGLSTFYILSDATLLGESLADVTMLIPLGSIALALVYLLSPAVRRVYLSNGWVAAAPEPPSE
ncbi:MAG: hypothetical protein H0T53_06670 [Herpetosiphonaceae bacterium]|nr:hypothetical protein [Herpetosiphonaceae bacterium]